MVVDAEDEGITSTTGTTWTHESTGNVSIKGARIDLNPS